MPPSATVATAPPPRARRAPRIVDVALWYGPHSGGIRTYLDAKSAWADRTGRVDHHLVTPGSHGLRSLTLVASNGYRVPLQFGRVSAVLRSLRPDLVFAHDPFWSLPAAVASGAPVVAVHHASSALEAASLPGPQGLYRRTFDAWRRHEYPRAAAVMAATTDGVDGARRLLPLRFGLDPAFRPRAEIERGREVVYAGRLSREKGVLDLLEAAASARARWPLRLVGSGPIEDSIHAFILRRGLGWRTRVEPFVEDREQLARVYARASCVAMPGPYETFGLVALEAAASGARVVACDSAPSVREAAAVAHTFRPGDVAGLAAAVESARSAPRDLAAAEAIASRNTWYNAFEAELDTVEGLLR